MASYRVPDVYEAEVIRRNHMTPEEYGVILTGDDFIVLLCYSTRDTVTIRQGDKKW